MVRYLQAVFSRGAFGSFHRCFILRGLLVRYLQAVSSRDAFGLFRLKGVAAQLVFLWGGGGGKVALRVTNDSAKCQA